MNQSGERSLVTALYPRPEVALMVSSPLSYDDMLLALAGLVVFINGGRGLTAEGSAPQWGRAEA